MPGSPPRASLQSTESLKGDVCGTDRQAGGAAGISGERTRGLDPRKLTGDPGQSRTGADRAEPRVQIGASKTSATGGPVPPLTRLMVLDPAGPRASAALHAQPEASAYRPAQAWRGGWAAHRTCPRGAASKSFQEGQSEPPALPARGRSRCCSGGTKRRSASAPGCAAHCSPNPAAA